jgi:hypothetical protein
MSFDLSTFTQHLIAESLVFDPEYGVIGHVSLIDPTASREIFIAYFVPEEGVYVIDEGVEWVEPYAEMEEEIGYLFAADTQEHLVSEAVEEIAAALLRLAGERGLYPSVSLAFEDDDAV